MANFVTKNQGGKSVAKVTRNAKPVTSTKPVKEVRSYTTTSGEKVRVMSDGSKTYTGTTESLMNRGDAMLDQTKAEGEKPFKDSKYDKFKASYEPTVISDVNIREKVIPDIKKRTDALTETGQFYDNVGNLHNADGSIAEDVATSEQQKEADQLMESADQDSQMIMGTLDKLMKQTDSNTASQVRSIKNQYDVRRQQLEEINRREQAATDTALLLGGSSRYTSSGIGISAAFERAGIMELATIDAQEQAAISEVKAAQADQNYKLASTKLEYAEKLRKEKIDKATEIANTIAEENKAMTEMMQKQSREYAIAELFRQGITDPAEIMAYTDGNISLKEINDVLKIINPDANLSGMSSDYRTYKAMQKAGEIPSTWSLFDYKTALANATRAPKTTTGVSDFDTFDFSSAKAGDVKQMVKEMFPLYFGSKLILELSDEELREFMNYYQNETSSQQMNIDPETAFTEWAQAFDVNQEDEGIAAKIDALFK